MMVPSIGAWIGAARRTLPLACNDAISSSVKPTMRRRERVASSVISPERRSFCAATSAASAACHSLSGAALPS